VAEAIFNMIERAGYDVWWAPRDLAPGVLWQREIRYAFTEAKLVVLLATKTAFSSRFVMMYVEMARERGIPLVVAELEPIPRKDYPPNLPNVEPVKVWRWHTSHDKADLKPLLDSIRAQIGPSRKKKSSLEREPPNGDKTKQRAGHDVFVSYKRDERERIDPYVKRLIDGGLQVWWDALIRPGANWGLSIEKALRESRSVAVFWTPMSVSSDEVYNEADHGMRINALFPVLLETCEVPIRMSRIQYLDLTRPNADQSFDGLILGIRNRVVRT
jgi:hypothetical protein